MTNTIKRITFYGTLKENKKYLLSLLYPTNIFSMKKIIFLLILSFFIIHSSFAYELTQDDKNISETISEKISSENSSYISLFSTKIQDIIDSWKYSDRVNAILENILKKINTPQETKTVLEDIIETVDALLGLLIKVSFVKIFLELPIPKISDGDSILVVM